MKFLATLKDKLSLEARLVLVVIFILLLAGAALFKETFHKSYTDLRTGLSFSEEMLDGRAITTSPNCYNPENVTKVGKPDWHGCSGMLIVDNFMLRSAAGDHFVNNHRAIGDGSFNFAPGDRYAPIYLTETYTFQDDDKNIFTGQVTDMSYLLALSSYFNDDIGYWDTSRVKNFEFMFAVTPEFNHHIGDWNTSAALNMSGMFNLAESFDQDISSWDTTNVFNMLAMFSGASAFNRNISNWNIARVEFMEEMFLDALAFNQDLSKWCSKFPGMINDPLNLSATNRQGSDSQSIFCPDPIQHADLLSPQLQ